MSHGRWHEIGLILLAMVLTLGVSPGVVTTAQGADHGDAPLASNDTAADINDIYAFVDPNDNSQLVMILTFRGFIASGENANFGQFDPRLLYAFEIETTGDAVADIAIGVTFSRQTSRAAPQTATVLAVRLPTFAPLFTFTAPTTISNVAAVAPPQVVTVNPPTGIQFFAGMTDDPFFFDIPGFGRFTASVLAGAPDVTQLNRGRDSFAGYNTMAIAIRIPRTLLTTGNRLGIGSRTFRITGSLAQPPLTIVEQLDRAGVPAVNVALTPFPVKDTYNVADPTRDVAGEFAPGIIATLTALGTSPGGINTLAGIAVTNGDLLRLDLNIANSGPGGGNNAAAAFPNGRRLGDDVIDTIITIVTNGTRTTGDSVNGNELVFQDNFPFLALPNQPRATGVADDGTRN
jgi:hypothetical protein